MRAITIPICLSTNHRPLSIARTKDDNLRLRLIYCPYSYGNNPCATVSVSVLSDFMQTSNPMPPSMFTVGDIYFSKIVFSKPIYHLFSTQLSIGIANKRSLLTHFGDATFSVMRNVIPFRSHITAPVRSPKRTCSCCSNISLPLCWPLPSHHTVTLSNCIPLTSDAGTFQNAMDDLGCVNSSWLTNNPLLDLWL